MKSDREFLDGIYEKAELQGLNEPEAIATAKAKIINFKPKKSIGIRAAAAAAALILMAVPSVLYLNEPKMETPKDYITNAPMAIRAMLVAPDVQALADNSDLVLTGKITKIEKSVYDEDNGGIITNVKLRPTELIKGDFTGETLNIKVSGGWIKKTDSFEPYEAVFEKSEDILVFLKVGEIQDENTYILSDGEYSKYSRKDLESGERSYIGKDDATISITEIRKITEEIGE